MSDVRAAAFMYFSMALLCLVVCFISLFILRKVPFYIYHKNLKNVVASGTSDHIDAKVTKQDYIDTFKQVDSFPFKNIFLLGLAYVPQCILGLLRYSDLLPWTYG